jgi:hypothetical protein
LSERTSDRLSGQILRHEESQPVKNDVLGHALFMDKPEVIELAITHGAEIASVPFLDVLLTGDRAIVASFLERGADPSLTNHSRGPFIGCVPRQRSGRISTAGAVDLTLLRACRGRRIWPFGSSPKKEI